MKNKNYMGMTIRIPIDIARELKKLRKDRDLASYGAALKCWIEQQKDEEIESRLTGIEEKINLLLPLAEAINMNQKMMRKHTAAVNNISKFLKRIIQKVTK